MTEPTAIVAIEVGGVCRPHTLQILLRSTSGTSVRLSFTHGRGTVPRGGFHMMPCEMGVQDPVGGGCFMMQCKVGEPMMQCDVGVS